MVTHEVENRKTDTPPKSPMQQGYKFIGWSLSKDGNETFDFNTPITSDITLYPVWSINSYKVTFVYGEDVTFSSSEISVDYGNTIPPQNVTRTGYSLKGWSTKEDGSEPYDLSSHVTSDITLYPVWSINSYKVTFVYGEDVTFSSSEISVEYGKPIPPQDITRVGYSLKGWSTKEDGSEPYDLNTPVTSDVTLYPVWSINSYKVTFVCGEGVVNPPSEISVDYGNTIPPQNVTRVGYSLKGWSTKEDGSEPYDLSSHVTSDITLYPVWSINSYKVTFVYGEDVTFSSSEISVDYGNTIPPQNVTRVGYSLKGWSTKEDGSEPYDLNTLVISDITLYPVWSINSYKVTFVYGENVTFSSSEISVDHGNPIPPQNVTRAGYSLKGWSTKADGSESYDLSTPVKGNITLYPIWVKTCTITFVCEEDVSNAPESITVDINTVVEAPEAPSKYGYDFKGWKTDLESEGYFSFGSITTDITLYPVFEGKEMIVNFIYEDEASLASKTYRTGDLLTPSSIGIGLDDSIFTWKLVDSSTEEQYPVDKSLPYSESGYTFVVHISSSYMSVDESGAISGTDGLKAKEGPYTLFIPRYLNGKEVTSIKEFGFLSGSWYGEKQYQFEKVILPDSIAEIGNSAFCHSLSLTEINIPSPVKSIGDHAFVYCSSLETVVLSEGIETIGNYSFGYCDALTEIKLPSSIKTIGAGTFSSCENLESITLPEKITVIPKECFSNCIKLANISFEGTIKEIGEGAFFQCESLTSFIIPDTVTSIGVQAFQRCSNLSDVTLPSGLTSLSEGIFSNCTSLTKITIPNSITSIGNNAFNNCKGITSIVIPESVTSIGDYAFCQTNITSITIPKSVISIGSFAFLQCKSLTEITINGAITTIKEQTFNSCTSLTSITIPDSVTSLDKGAFSHCHKLEFITIGKCVSSISNNAFEYCSSLKNINIPDKVSSIGEFAFSECTNLRTVNLNEDLKTIGSDAFSGCSSLETITIPSTVTSIGENTFYNCINLSNISVDKTEGTIPDAPWGGNVFWNNETNQKTTKSNFTLEWKTE